MIENEYDRLAPYYDFLARIVFGKSLLRAKRHFLSLLPSKAKILLIGGGTGQILPDILKDNRRHYVVYLERSGKMISLARSRADRNKVSGQILFVEGDESNLPEREKFDVIITNFFLDQFREDRLELLMEILFNRLNSSGLWLFTDFQLQKGQPHYWWQILLIKTMLAFFRVATNLKTNSLPDFPPLFQRLNLTLIEEKRFLKKLIVSRVYLKQ